jgi:hypothetical protein
MRAKLCDTCHTELTEPAYLVYAYPTHARMLVCTTCYDHQRGWQPDGPAFYLHARSLPPTPCAHCGLVVIRPHHRLLEHVTCSHACRTALTRKQTGNLGSGQPCATCGQLITTGRADARYCSNACRQTDYRKRKNSHVQP